MGHPITALVKTFLDQAIMAPAGIGLFFTAMGVLEGKSTSQVRRFGSMRSARLHVARHGCWLGRGVRASPSSAGALMRTLGRLNVVVLNSLRLLPSPMRNCGVHQSVAWVCSAVQAVAEAKEKFKPTLMANYVLWPAANLINFAFVPPSQRILYCNVIYVSDKSAGVICYQFGVATAPLFCRYLRCPLCATSA